MSSSNTLATLLLPIYASFRFLVFFCGSRLVPSVRVNEADWSRNPLTFQDRLKTLLIGGWKVGRAGNRSDPAAVRGSFLFFLSPSVCHPECCDDTKGVDRFTGADNLRSRRLSRDPLPRWPRSSPFSFCAAALLPLLQWNRVDTFQ